MMINELKNAKGLILAFLTCSVGLPVFYNNNLSVTEFGGLGFSTRV
jgi:hypothetical protein